MMDILMYLFETYIHSESELTLDQDELEEELLRAGFHQNDIYKSLDWLEALVALQQGQRLDMSNSSVHSTRIYTEQEMQKLDVQCRGFLLFLEQIQVLTPETREMIIDRVVDIDGSELVLDDLKWIILMVLFNVPGNESAYTQMEELLHSTEQGLLH